MATTNTPTTVAKSKTRGDKFTPKGTMPKDKLARFKLTGNIVTDADPSHSRFSRKAVRKSSREIKWYRQEVHGVTEKRLPASLRQTVHYFMVPMSRADSDNPKDRKGMEQEAKS